MAEFASKGVAGAGLGTGIAGLALGVLNSSNNGNGLLGGLLGGGNQNMVSALQAENSQLKAENYSDKNAKEVYMQSLTDNRRLRDETFAYLKPLSDEAANNRVELAKLQAELKCCCEKQELREQIVLGKVNELALTTQAKFGCLDGTIAGMMGTLNNITKTIVPMSAICGVDNEGNGVMACLVPDATGKIKSNALKFRTINMDEASATKTRSFKVYINVTAEISNTNFGLGQLFPTTK